MNPSELYQSYIDAENSRDRAGMERCLAEDMRVHINGVAQLSDRAADAEATDRLLDLYPEYERLLHRVFHVDNTVVAEWEMRGVEDVARGVPALAVVGCTIAEVIDGAIASAHLYTDPQALAFVLDSAGSDATN